MKDASCHVRECVTLSQQAIQAPKASGQGPKHQESNDCKYIVNIDFLQSLLWEPLKYDDCTPVRCGSISPCKEFHSGNLYASVSCRCGVLPSAY